ncbi:MAG: hypothetical protein BACD_03321 [Bacteroides rodentium]
MKEVYKAWFHLFFPMKTDFFCTYEGMGEVVRTSLIYNKYYTTNEEGMIKTLLFMSSS